MIPRRFFWLSDLLIVGIAFLLAHALVPAFYGWISNVKSAWAIPVVVLDNQGAIASVAIPSLFQWAWTLALMAPTVLLSLGQLGGYTPLLDQSRARLVIGTFTSPLVGLSLITLVLFALKETDVSRLFAFSFALLSSLGLCAYRMLLRGYFQHRLEAGSYAKNVVLIGMHPTLELMARHFTENISPQQYLLLGALHVPPPQSPFAGILSETGPVAGTKLPYLGEVSQLSQLLIHWPIQEVVAIQPTNNDDWLSQVIRDCEYFRVVLRIVPEALLSGDWHNLQHLYRAGPLRLPAIVLAPPYWNSDSLFVKRLFDVVASVAAMVLLFPLFLMIAIAIKLTTPLLPVFYPWRVVGLNGVEFTGYKFTTMAADADQRKTDLMAQNEMTGPVFKIKNDPRTTALGRFLRKYSLNELPQLWSVFRGDMSLVGPRPAFRHELERYELWHKRKLSVKPGLTCLWQIRGRNKISNFDDWVRMDLEYIDHWSLWLDLKILFRTVWVVIAGTGS